MKLGVRRAFVCGRVVVLGGFGLLLLAVTRGDTALGSSATTTVAADVGQRAVISGMHVASGVSGGASEVHIPKKPHPRTPVKPPGPPDEPPRGIPPWHPRK